MAITDRIPSNVTDDEIRTRINELNQSTEEDDYFDPWFSVEALEGELSKRQREAEEDEAESDHTAYFLGMLYSTPEYTYDTDTLETEEN